MWESGFGKRSKEENFFRKSEGKVRGEENAQETDSNEYTADHNTMCAGCFMEIYPGRGEENNTEVPSILGSEESVTTHETIEAKGETIATEETAEETAALEEETHASVSTEDTSGPGNKQTETEENPDETETKSEETAPPEVTSPAGETQGENETPDW